MRPVRLRVRGFGAFRDDTDIDFADADVFALVGPTGAGKSTVIDAVCFALYGNVPRYGERSVEPVISLGANEARVELTFESGGTTYVAARVVRRGGREGRASTREARLEAVGPDGVSKTLAGSARDMSGAVEAVIGLSFEHFTRCVVLPQGEFARFLHDRPADRQALLERLLGLGVYDLMARQANQRAAEAKAAGAYAEARLTELPAHDDATVEAAHARVAALDALSADLAPASAELAAIRAAVADARQRAVSARHLVEALDDVVVPDAVAELGRILAAARAAGVAAAAAHAAAQARTEAAVAAAARTSPVAELEAAAVAHERIAKGVVVRAERAHAVGDVVTARDEADAKVVAAEAAEDEARRDVEAARAAHAAHALAARLVAGEPCPVCGQDVAVVPANRVPAALAGPDRAVSAAERRTASARRAAREAGERLQIATGELARAEAMLEELGRAVATHPDPHTLAQDLTEARAFDAAVQQARHDEADDAAAVAAATEAQTRAEAGLGHAQELYHRQRDAVATAGPPAPGPDLMASWSALVAWAVQQRPAVVEAVEAADADAADGDARTTALLAELASRAAAVGVAVGSAVTAETLTRTVARAEEQARQAVTAIEAAQAEAERLGSAVAAESERYAVAHELGRHLSAAGFPRWLVVEALDTLVTDASGLLERLSGGQYALTAPDDGSELLVVDHANANELRSVRSLSGGETFQASLALALALSDHLAALAARGGAPLDAIFLDEGFGTLDAESLDTVASAIESLAGGGRMVGIVTHVPELAERVPIRFVVTKGPRTSAVERVVA